MAHVISALQGAFFDAALMARAGLLFVRLVFIYLAFILCAVVSQAQTHESAVPAPERGVKAAFLYKFAGYVDWPAGTFAKSDTPLTITVVGDDELADTLAQYVVGRTVDDRPLIVRKQKGDDLPDGTNIMFIARAETSRLQANSKLLRPILMVTEAEGALNQGSIINFVSSGGRVRFEVSTGSAEKRHLKLSSGLLRVALNVRTDAR